MTASDQLSSRKKPLQSGGHPHMTLNGLAGFSILLVRDLVVATAHKLD
jgi:hypothetical protein